MDKKSPLASKTIWINCLITVAAIITACLNLEWVAKYPQVVPILVGLVAVINTILRQFTTTALTTNHSAKLLIFALLATFAFTGSAMADTWGGDGGGDKAVVTTDAELAKQLQANPGMSLKQRRAMGITFKNIRLKLKELKKTGELAGLDRAEVSALVMSELVMDNPKAFADPSLDWDKILSFIEMILKILAIFGFGL